MLDTSPSSSRRASPTARGGTTSATIPRAASAAAVAEPIAATVTPASSRTSGGSTRSTPLALVTTSTSKRPMSGGSKGSGSMLIAGASMTAAPSSSSRARRPLAWERARVTTTRHPCSGRRSNQARCSRMRATSPTTVIAGAGRPAAASAIAARGAVTVCWSGRVPCEITAAGVSAAIPWAISRRAFSSRAPTPMRKTSVPGVAASEPQSSELSGFDGSSWPVTNVTWAANPRCVTGMPAYAGTAYAELTPGTTSNGMPAASSASASSPPRPKTKGSPPFRRTTAASRPPSSTSSSFRRSCVIACSPGPLPA